MNKLECNICGNKCGNTQFSLFDYNLDKSTKFDYFQCSSCECLQKADLQEDTSKYYPTYYYSFSDDNRSSFSSKIKWFIRDIRNNYYRTQKGILGELVHRILPCDSIAMIHKINPPVETKILDVGCGSDALLLQYLSSLGFKNLIGIDPFISSIHIKRGSANIYKKSIFDISECFDLITFNHSLEHMIEQKSTLLRCNKILNNNGQVILRIPTVDSFSWKNDKNLWPNLDAPRHLFLHSVKSITLLANQCGFKVDATYYDSTAFQLWGKKMYEKGIPLFSKNKLHTLQRLWLRLFYSFFNYKRVQYLNNNSLGDSIVVILKKRISE